MKNNPIVKIGQRFVLYCGGKKNQIIEMRSITSLSGAIVEVVKSGVWKKSYIHNGFGLDKGTIGEDSSYKLLSGQEKEEE